MPVLTARVNVTTRKDQRFCSRKCSHMASDHYGDECVRLTDGKLIALKRDDQDRLLRDESCLDATKDGE